MSDSEDESYNNMRTTFGEICRSLKRNGSLSSHTSG